MAVDSEHLFLPSLLSSRDTTQCSYNNKTSEIMKISKIIRKRIWENEHATFPSTNTGGLAREEGGHYFLQESRDRQQYMYLTLAHQYRPSEEPSCGHPVHNSVADHVTNYEATTMRMKFTNGCSVYILCCSFFTIVANK